MLRRLEIENYGLIARARVEFAAGASIFTGETGSGKTMLLGAIDFALGARAGPDAVRRGAAKTAVTLAFDPDEPLRARMAADGFALDDGEEGTIAREMTDAGRSSVRVNGRAATAGYVREIADAIAEIVGQHEAQRLLSPAYHLELLDRYAGSTALQLRDEVAAAYARAAAAADLLERLTRDERDARERYEEAARLVRDVEEAAVDAAEIEPIRERRGFLENVERIAFALQTAREAFTTGESAAANALGAGAAALSGVEKYGEELREMARRAQALQSECGELGADLARALEAAEFDPAELEAINARLALLERLQRRYGESLEGLLERAQAARATMDEFENRDELLERARAAREAASAELVTHAAALTAARRKAGAALAKRVVKEFGDIALGAGRFEVLLDPLERIGASGADRVEFHFAANAGESPRAIARVASGGELSRVLLALVVTLAQSRAVGGALIFDEIDAGVGGATATAVGERIAQLARGAQVICVTHLAQIATAADRHYVLEKNERKGETTIGVRELNGANEREAEIARMLSGEKHDAALLHARALLVRGGKG